MNIGERILYKAFLVLGRGSMTRGEKILFRLVRGLAITLVVLAGLRILQLLGVI